jgi:hypothetical protein
MIKLKHLTILTLGFIVFWSCTYEKEPIPDECLGNIILVLDSKLDSSCGGSDGSISLNATGGEGIYTFSLNGGTAQASPVFNSLSAGSYTVVASDGICSAEFSIEILNADGVNAMVQASQSSCDNSTGSIVVNATGGIGPYEYKLGTGSFQSGDTFNALAPGNYVVFVKDATGCQVELQSKVKSDVAFASIKAIIQTNCAVSGCHNGSQSPDLTNNNIIVSNANRIQSRTAVRTMPPSSSGRSLTQTEIDQIACWVADGASTN